MTAPIRKALRVHPISMSDARAFVDRHHRHNTVPGPGMRFATAVYRDDDLAGVGIAGNPVARMLGDGVTLEIVRVCTDGTPDVCSMIYGALGRVAKALGYRRLITYTLASEPGISPKAAGFVLDANLPARNGWHCPSRPRYDTDLFGNPVSPPEAKVRWVRYLWAP